MGRRNQADNLVSTYFDEATRLNWNFVSIKVEMLNYIPRSTPILNAHKDICKMQS